MSKLRDVGGEELIFAPGRSNVDGNELLAEFIRKDARTRRDVAESSQKQGSGPVLAAWPTREKVVEIADDHRTRALRVIPWAKGEVDAWVASAEPELPGPAVRPTGRLPLDPVAIQGPTASKENFHTDSSATIPSAHQRPVDPCVAEDGQTVAAT